MFCTKCGNNMPDGSAFCTKCGAKMEPLPVKQTEGTEDLPVVDMSDAEDPMLNVNFQENPTQEGGPAPQGNPMQQGGSIPQGNSMPQNGMMQGNPQMQPQKAPMSQKTKNNIIIGSISGVVLIGVIVLLIVLLGGTRINLTDEEIVKVTFNGGDGRGYADYSMDSSKLNEISEDALGKNPSLDEQLAWYSFTSSIRYSFDKSDELSNGDKVTLSVTWDEDLAKEAGVKVSGDDLEVEVSGLEPAKPIDVFNTLEVTFEGFDGNGTLSYKNTSEDDFMYSVYFSADKSDGLSNGDKVIITADVSDYTLDQYNYVLTEKEKEYTVEGLGEMSEIDLFAGLELDYSGTSPYAGLSLRNTSTDDFIQNYVYYEADKTSNIKNGDVITVTASVDEGYAADYGYTIGVTTKEYTVSDIDEYVSFYEDITEDVLKDMDQQAKDAIDTWIVNQENWNEYKEMKIDDPKHVGDCFVDLKDGLVYDSWSYSFENAVFMCYKVKETFKEDGKKKTQDVYLVVSYENFIKYSDGTIYVDLTSGNVENDVYNSYQDFFEDVIRSKKVNYNTYEFKD